MALGTSEGTGSISPVSPLRWPRNMPVTPPRLRRGSSAAAPISSGSSGSSSGPSTTSATMQVTLSLLPASRLARTISTAA